MLILSRRVGEVIVIDEKIFCRILGRQGNQISLGFDAPESVVIHRQEIFDKIQADKKIQLAAMNYWH